MDNNKQEFKSILNSTVLRKYRDSFKGLEHFYNQRTVGTKNTPIEEYGVKWIGGSIFLRRYLNEQRAELLVQMGGNFDSVEINFYDSDADNFVSISKTLIKETIREVELAYASTNN